MTNIYEFSDKVNASPQLRKTLVEKYIQNIQNNTPIDDIVSEWVEMKYHDMIAECKEDGADILIERIAKQHPEFLESEFNVDVSLALN